MRPPGLAARAAAERRAQDRRLHSLEQRAGTRRLGLEAVGAGEDALYAPPYFHLFDDRRHWGERLGSGAGAFGTTLLITG